MEYRHQMHHYRLRKVYLFTSPTHHLHLEEDAINVTSTLSQPYSVNNEKKPATGLWQLYAGHSTNSREMKLNHTKSNSPLSIIKGLRKQLMHSFTPLVQIQFPCCTERGCRFEIPELPVQRGEQIIATSEMPASQWNYHRGVGLQRHFQPA